MQVKLVPGDEIRFIGHYYVLVLDVHPLVMRIKKGGPYGTHLGDLTFAEHPSRGELAARIDVMRHEHDPTG